MRARRSIAGRLGLGVALAALLAGPPARAGDGWDDLRTVLFGGVEAGPSSFANAGFKRALGPSLDRDGWLAMGTLGGGLRRERLDGSGAEAWRVTTIASGLVGHQWITGGTVAALFGGVEVDHAQLISGGEALRWAEPRFGGRLQAELWSRPTEATLLTATLVAGSARGHLWARTSWGHEVWRGVYAGPEAVAYAEDGYREGRLGLHLTGLSLAGVTLGVSAGGSFTETRSGGYVTLQAYTRR